MKILLTGTTGYIGRRLLPVLLAQGHQVVCCVRDSRRFDAAKYQSDQLSVIEVDFLKPDTLTAIPPDVKAAFYLIHAMAAANEDFEVLERQAAQHFVQRLQHTQVKQVVYLSGIVNATTLSKHLSSRKRVEDILGQASFHLTTLRAGIIVGSGSASFEIIRDLVEKLPVMVAPRWLNTRSQPIAIRNVIEYLVGVLHNPNTYDKSYDIGGPGVLTYKDMLLRFAAVRGLKRRIITVPVMTPKLSSYWLYFVTATSYTLARNLVHSMRVEIICTPNSLQHDLGIVLLSYEEAIRIAFDKIENNAVVSSWKDALTSKVLQGGISMHIEVPTHGCYIDHRQLPVADATRTLQKIWAIGGATGWYYANWLWALRGLLDKLFGGVGLRRGRKSPNKIEAGDALDFWRVLYANQAERRLLLYAEMKLPGEAWLEFRLVQGVLHQTATFRPLGLWGRLYWYAVWPLHGLIFNGMLHRIAA